MSDRELLEAAAKAADVIGEYGGLHDLESWWNPLTNDGDALRLAVKLRLSIEREFDRIDVCRDSVLAATEFLYEKPTPTDIYAATRRAIVRAAAAMPPPP